MRQPQNQLLVLAICEQSVLKFIYNGQIRLVEPQTYGVSTTGKEVLRAYQISGGSRAGVARMAKLFEVAKMKDLERTDKTFRAALNSHNPHDSAMTEIFATLPKAPVEA